MEEFFFGERLGAAARIRARTAVTAPIHCQEASSWLPLRCSTDRGSRRRGRPTDAFFGHPRGLSTLFFSEMWERFSYYGMRGFLILYMTAPLALGGMGLDTATAAAIYGMYTSMVYLMSLPGRLARRSAHRPAQRGALRRHPDRGRPLLAGGPGHDDVLPRPAARRARHRPAQAEHQRHRRPALLRSRTSGATRRSRSSTWGSTSARSSVRSSPAFSRRTRRSARTITGWGIDPNSAWHWGFGAAGVGMTLGLVQYVLGGTRARQRRPRARPSRNRPPRPRESSSRPRSWHRRRPRAAGAARRRHRDRRAAGHAASRSPTRYGYLLLGVTVAFFAWLFPAGNWTPVERGRLYMIGVYFVAAALFWSRVRAGRIDAEPVRRPQHATTSCRSGRVPEQLVAVAERAADLHPRAGVRVALGASSARNQPATPTKFALGLIGVGARVPLPRAGRADRRRRRKVGVVVAVHGLPDPHDRRAVPEPGRPELDDQARAGADRQPDDGRLVPGRVGRQLPWRHGGVVLRSAAAADAAHARSPCADRARRSDAALAAAG